MAISVALAISFPYQGGGDSYLRAVDANDGEKVDSLVEDAIMLEEDATGLMDSNSSVAAGTEMSGLESSTNEKSNPLPTEHEETTTEEALSNEQTNNVDASSITAEDAEQNTETISGLFGPIVTAADEQSPNGQANTTTSTTDSEYSSCQMKLQQADTNLDNVINAFEYITFLHNLGSISLSTTQLFDELPSDDQANFDHLATTHTDASGGDNDVVLGIPIATMEEMQRVCVYISKKGSSAMGEFDWDQISSLP